MNIFDQLKRDEGFRGSPYPDEFGIPTLGWGFNLLADPLTEAECETPFRNRVAKAARAVHEKLPWTVSLSEPRFGVLVNMAYQLGINGLLGFKIFLKLLEQNLILEAAEEMMCSNWSHQTPERAKRLKQQLIKDEWI